MNRLRRLVLGLLLALTLSFSIAAVAPRTAEAAPRAATTATTVQPHNTWWERDYLYDWFATKYKCQKWGRGAVYGNSVQKKIPGVIAYYCHRHFYNSKWSIDLKYADGSSSWSVGPTL